MVWEEKLKFFLLLLRIKCHKVGLAIIIVGPSDMDEQLVQLSWDLMNGFGVDEQLVHFGVHLSQGTNVFETQCPVQVELSLGSKAGGLNVKAPNVP
jgi:hypothetical protein